MPSFKTQIESYSDIDVAIRMIDSAATIALNKNQEFFITYGTDKDMTVKQNGSLHLWFTLCAEHLNNAGLPFEKKSVFGNKMIKMDWTLEIFKREVFKPTLLAMTSKESTQHQSIKEPDKVVSELYRFFSDHGVTLPEFPKKRLTE